MRREHEQRGRARCGESSGNPFVGRDAPTARRQRDTLPLRSFWNAGTPARIVSLCRRRGVTERP
jgi:hypothetical protein